MNKIRIVSIIVSKIGVTVYLADGQELNLSNDSWKTKIILDQALAPVTRGETVELDLDDFSIEAKIEKKTGGFIRFIREKVSRFFGVKSEQTLQNTTAMTNVQAPPALEPASILTEEQEERLVAIVGNVRVPGVEALEKQMEYAAFNDATGFQKFMERIAAIIDDRGHTVDELLNFIRRADLQFAADGSIIAYKVLKSRTEDGQRFFVDCHTGRVPQRVGSFVYMDKKLVDPSRRTECSTGLHIARRGYISGFSGDVITLVKIAPEDVIAVPYKEPDKMRVAGYHILFELPAEAHRLLRKNQPMTSDETAAKMLADAIAGNHIGVIENVKIGGPNGTDVSVVKASDETAPEIGKNGMVKALDDKPKEVAVTVKDVKRKVAAVKANQPAVTEEPTDLNAALGAILKGEELAILATNKKAAAATPAEARLKNEMTAATYDLVKVPEKWREAFGKVARGEISQREAERLYKISAKKLRALLREQNII
jgi:hypothetical protein